MRFVRNQSIEAAPLQQELMLFSAATKKFCVLNPVRPYLARLEEPRQGRACVALQNSSCSQSGTVTGRSWRPRALEVSTSCQSRHKVHKLVTLEGS
jgi:hypothetical protein